MSATDPSAPGLPLAGGGGGGTSLPVSTFSDVLAGAAASSFAATDGSGNGTLLTATQARVALGLGAVLAPNAGSVTNTGAVTGTTSASSFVASIAIGAAVNDKSVDLIPWPATADVSMTITARIAFSVAGAGDQTGRILIQFGGSTSHTIAFGVDQNGNTAYRLDGTDIVGTTAGTPRATTWVRLRISGDRVTAWVSSSGVFASALYTTTYAWLITDGSTALATIASVELRGMQETATATGVSTVTFDNLSIVQGT